VVLPFCSEKGPVINQLFMSKQIFNSQELMNSRCRLIGNDEVTKGKFTLVCECGPHFLKLFIILNMKVFQKIWINRCDCCNLFSFLATNYHKENISE